MQMDDSKYSSFEPPRIGQITSEAGVVSLSTFQLLASHASRRPFAD